MTTSHQFMGTIYTEHLHRCLSQGVLQIASSLSHRQLTILFLRQLPPIQNGGFKVLSVRWAEMGVWLTNGCVGDYEEWDLSSSLYWHRDALVQEVTEMCCVCVCVWVGGWVWVCGCVCFQD